MAVSFHWALTGVGLQKFIKKVSAHVPLEATKV